MRRWRRRRCRSCCVLKKKVSDVRCEKFSFFKKPVEADLRNRAAATTAATTTTTAAATNDWCSLKWFSGSPVFKKTPRSKLLQERDTFLESTKEKKCLTKIWTDTTGTFSTSFCVSTNLIDCFVSEVQLSCINFFVEEQSNEKNYKSKI